jgi:ribosomal protein S25
MLGKYPSRTRREIAQVFGLQPSLINDRLRAEIGRKRIISRGQPAEKFNITELLALNVIQDDDVLEEVVKATAKKRLITAQLQELQQFIRGGRTKEKQIARIGEFLARPDIKARSEQLPHRGIRAMAIKTQLFAAFGQISRFLTRYRSLEAMEMTDLSDIERLVEQIDILCTNLVRLRRYAQERITASNPNNIR